MMSLKGKMPVINVFNDMSRLFGYGKNLFFIDISR